MTIFNGNETTAMRDLELALEITDDAGNVRTDLFEISTTNLDKLTGIDGTGTLDANTEGTATIRFIPKHSAAPLNSVIYKFGGSLSYLDPFTNERVTVKLFPVQLEVQPNPRLELHYFLQRDVLGDDPFTADAVEPMAPAEFALLIHNRGYGTANNVQIATAQPKIVDNQKGLAVGFTLMDSVLNGKPTTMGLQRVELGTIGAQQSAVAQWWLTASVQGHFTSMDAKVTALSHSGNPDVSLIESVTTHELIRSVVADGDALPDFLVTELNIEDLPDTLYFSDGSVADVFLATATPLGEITGKNASVKTSVTATDSGWHYARVPAPSTDLYDIARVTRADGTELPLRNVWLTDRTFPDGGDPVYETNLHLIDNVDVGTHEYTVELIARDETPPAVDHFAGVAAGSVVSAATAWVDVVFTEPIDPATLAVADITLKCQNQSRDLSGITITQQDERRYRLGNLAALTATDGLYQLTVQAAGVTDPCGNPGKVGKTLSWTKAQQAPAVLEVTGVTPGAFIQQLDRLTIRFSCPLKNGSFTADKIRIQQAVAANLTVVALDDARTLFEIGGLAEYLSLDGEYALSIDMPSIQALSGHAGLNPFALTWTMDRTGPAVVTMVKTAPVAALAGEYQIQVRLSEAVTGMTLANLQLSRDATPLLLPPAVKIVPVAADEYLITGLQALTQSQGRYEIKIDAASLVDLAGNRGTGTEILSWEVDTTPPGLVADLAITPDTGISTTDGITASRSFTVTGTLPEAGLQVEVLAVYPSGSLPLKPAFAATSRELNVPVSLTSGGHVTLTVRCTDASGQKTDTALPVFIDEMDLEATLSGMPQAPEEPVNELRISFSNEIVETELTPSVLGLTCDGSPCPLIGVAITKLDARQYRVSGVDSLVNPKGAYLFSVDLTKLHKLQSGKAGSRTVTAAWESAPLDKTAPTVVNVWINGSAPQSEYRSLTDVAVQFSESVNVPELLANGQIGLAMRMISLDRKGASLGAVASSPQEFTWNAATNTLIWKPGEPLQNVGTVRLYFDSQLLLDDADNPLGLGGLPAVTCGIPLLAEAATVVQASAYAAPVWHDYNADGLSDLLVGEKADEATGKIRVYLNTGTATVPRFDRFTYLPVAGQELAVPAANCLGASFCFADITADGRADLIVGRSDGTVWLHRETAAQPGIHEFAAGQLIWAGTATLPVSERAMPTVLDLDHNGTPELLVGGLDGKIRVLKYDGATQTCDGLSYLADQQQNSIVIAAGRSSPAFADWSADGMTEMVTGDSNGQLWLYVKNSRAAQSWLALPLALPHDADIRSRPCFADYNGDGLMDLLVGTAKGTVSVMLGVPPRNPALTFTVDDQKVKFDSTSVAVTENLGSAAVLVQGGGAEAASSVAYWIVPGTATAGSDYTAPPTTPQRLTWAAGEVGCKTISIPIKTDALLEDAETFHVLLGNPVNCVIGEPNVCTVTIADANSAESLADALDNALLKWTSVGTPLWAAQRTVTRDGVDAATSGALAGGKLSSLQTVVTGTGTLSFAWSVTGTGVLKLYDGKTVLVTATNATAWENRTIALAGTRATAHALKWEFTQGAGGTGRAYLDQVVWLPGGKANVVVNGSANTPAGGAVTGSGTYYTGAKVPLNAKPRPGWLFSGWTTSPAGLFAVPSTAAQLLTLGSQNVTATATFTKIPVVVGLPQPPEGGTVSGSGLCLPGKSVTLKATPAKNWCFTRWSDGLQTASRMVATATDCKLFAEFKLISAVAAPAISDPGAQQAMVGVPYTLPLAISSETLPTVTVTGLPTGLAYDAATKTIRGVPTAAGINKIVAISAKNVNPVATTRAFTLTVAPLPSWAQGNFNGWITSAAEYGTIAANVTAQGKITGTFAVAGLTYACRAASFTRRDDDGTLWVAGTASAGVGKPTRPWLLKFYQPTGTGGSGLVPPTLAVVDGWLSSDATGEPVAALYRNLWKEPDQAIKLTPYVGYYTATLPGSREYGSGYLTFTVDAAGGVKTVGKLADGTAVTISGTLILDEAGRLFVALYSSPVTYMGGGFFGLAEFVKPDAGEPTLVRPLDDLPLLWESHNPQATAPHGVGFSRELGVDGGWYNKLGDLGGYYQGQTLTIGTSGASVPTLTVGANRHHAVWWNPTGLPLSLIKDLRTGQVSGVAAPPTAIPANLAGQWVYNSGNTLGLVITLNRATGIFTGSFKNWFDYGATHTSKLVKFEGVLTPERANPLDGMEGRGFFLWGDQALLPNIPTKPYLFNQSNDFWIQAAPPAP